MRALYSGLTKQVLRMSPINSLNKRIDNFFAVFSELFFNILKSFISIKKLSNLCQVKEILISSLKVLFIEISFI